MKNGLRFFTAPAHINPGCSHLKPGHQHEPSGK
jgi:hypothetical protein